MSVVWFLVGFFAGGLTVSLTLVFFIYRKIKPLLNTVSGFGNLGLGGLMDLEDYEDE